MLDPGVQGMMIRSQLAAFKVAPSKHVLLVDDLVQHIILLFVFIFWPVLFV
jgi:hypothetical protein